MLDLVRVYKVDVFHHTVVTLDNDFYLVDAFAPEEQIARLEEAGYEIERLADAEEVGRQRQAEVGKGDQYHPFRPEDSGPS
jgi:hypothetical protein